MKRILLEGELLPHHLPFLFSDDEEHELDLQVTDTTDGNLEALDEGDVDYAITRPLNLISNVLDGLGVVGIARFFHTESGLLYRTGEGFESPDELSSDHTIGYRRITPGVAEAIVNRTVKKAGGEKRDDWKLKAIPENELGALDRGDVDVLVPGWIVPDGLRMQLGGIDGDFWYFNDFNIPANGDLILVTSEKHVEENPNGILNFVHAVHENLGKTRDHSDEALKRYQEQRPELADHPETTALLQTTIDGFTNIFSQDYATYSSWSTFFNEETDVEGLVDIDQLIDKRFLPVDAMSF